MKGAPHHISVNAPTAQTQQNSEQDKNDPYPTGRKMRYMVMHKEFLLL